MDYVFVYGQPRKQFFLLTSTLEPCSRSSHVVIPVVVIVVVVVIVIVVVVILVYSMLVPSRRLVALVCVMVNQGEEFMSWTLSAAIPRLCLCRYDTNKSNSMRMKSTFRARWALTSPTV